MSFPACSLPMETPQKPGRTLLILYIRQNLGNVKGIFSSRNQGRNLGTSTRGALGLLWGKQQPAVTGQKRVLLTTWFSEGFKVQVHKAIDVRPRGGRRSPRSQTCRAAVAEGMVIPRLGTSAGPGSEPGAGALLPQTHGQSGKPVGFVLSGSPGRGEGMRSRCSC